MLPFESEQSVETSATAAESIHYRLENLVKQNISTDAWEWLSQKASSVRQGDNKELNLAFAAIPRKTGKAPVRVPDTGLDNMNGLGQHFVINRWTVDRLSRIWLLMQVPKDNRQEYVKSIEALFSAAEMNELAALYASLPFLSYPEQWRTRCAEGIRSNIGLVLEAIICFNPYPADQLDEKAWNQLVLKAFFTEKPVNEVIGLDERSNQELANTLCDYAHERWAAGRQVNPFLWRCVAPFINAENFADIRRVAASENTVDREAAALACYNSKYKPAQELLENMNELKQLIERGDLSWETVAQKVYV